MTQPRIEVDSVSVRFGTNHVLQGINLALPPKRSLVILGRSGSGKSVLLKAMLGLVVPCHGCIRIDDTNVTSASEKKRDRIRRKIGMLFQSAALFDSLNVWENVAFGLVEGRGMAKTEAHKLALEKIVAVGLREDTAGLMPSELSGGMRKRVGLARALATSPEILFFDEPTTGLDPVMSQTINALISEQVRKTGAASITITHDIGSMRQIADEVAFLKQGRIAWQGSIDSIDSAQEPELQSFLAYGGSA